MSPPEGLGAAGHKLWSDITGEYDLNVAELAILEVAAFEADTVKRLQSEVDSLDSLRVRGSQGQPVSAPEVAELRSHGMALVSMLSRLHIPDFEEPTQPAARQPGPFAQPMSKAQAGGLGGRARAAR